MSDDAAVKALTLKEYTGDEGLNIDVVDDVKFDRRIAKNNVHLLIIQEIWNVITNLHTAGLRVNLRIKISCCLVDCKR